MTNGTQTFLIYLFFSWSQKVFESQSVWASKCHSLDLFLLKYHVLCSPFPTVQAYFSHSGNNLRFHWRDVRPQLCPSWKRHVLFFLFFFSANLCFLMLSLSSCDLRIAPSSPSRRISWSLNLSKLVATRIPHLPARLTSFFSLPCKSFSHSLSGAPRCGIYVRHAKRHTQVDILWK